MPAVRDADEETLIITNGFSCMEQIKQLTGRRAHHIAEVILMALEHPAPQYYQEAMRREVKSPTGRV